MSQCEHEPAFKMTKWSVPISYATPCLKCGEMMTVKLEGIRNNDPPPPKLRLVK